MLLYIVLVFVQKSFEDISRGKANVVEEGPVSMHGVYLWLLTSSDQCDCVMHLCGGFRSMAQKQV